MKSFILRLLLSLMVLSNSMPLYAGVNNSKIINFKTEMSCHSDSDNKQTNHCEQQCKNCVSHCLSLHHCTSLASENTLFINTNLKNRKFFIILASRLQKNTLSGIERPPKA